MALIASMEVQLAPGALSFPPTVEAQVRPAAAASRSAWPVALPATATVRLKQGGSLSGRVVKLTSSAVTLAVGHQSQTVSLANVTTIDFAQPNDLWVSLPNGRRQKVRPIRGLSLSIDELPSSSIQVVGTTNTAICDLRQVLTEDQFRRLSRNPDVVFVLNRVQVGADGRLGLRVRPYGVQ